jgi:hypothetical protein
VPELVAALPPAKSFAPPPKDALTCVVGKPLVSLYVATVSPETGGSPRQFG